MRHRFRNTVNNVRKVVNLVSKLTVKHIRKRHLAGEILRGLFVHVFGKVFGRFFGFRVVFCTFAASNGCGIQQQTLQQTLQWTI